MSEVMIFLHPNSKDLFFLVFCFGLMMWVFVKWVWIGDSPLMREGSTMLILFVCVTICCHTRLLMLGRNQSFLFTILVVYLLLLVIG